MALVADGTRVFVHNLSWQTTPESLTALMAGAGAVESVSILRYSNGRSKGCAIVKYATVEEAMAAIALLNNHVVDGRKLLVREDREAPEGAAPAAECAAETVTPVTAACGTASSAALTAAAPAACQ